MVILDLATIYLTYRFLVVLMLILELINLHLDTKTTILGKLVHNSWLFFQFSYKIATILDLATRYLTYRFFVVFMLILELINLHLDTKTIILGELVHASWLFLEFSDKMAAILDFAWLAALYGIAITFLAIFVFPDIKYIGIATISTRISLLLMKLKQKPYFQAQCLVKRKNRTPASRKMPAQPQFLSDLNIIGTKMLRNELRNFWVGDCIDSKHVIFLSHPYHHAC